eukprot:1159562-Pelagomonas_calceolata.AAC.4
MGSPGSSFSPGLPDQQQWLGTSPGAFCGESGVGVRKVAPRTPNFGRKIGRIGSQSSQRISWSCGNVVR